MTEPRKYRRYTRRQKATAVMAATLTTVAAAAEETGIPATTIGYWLDQPEFGELRAKTRVEIAAGSIVLAQLAQAELSKKIKAGEVEPRDLAVIYGIAIDKGQLLAGEATARTEHRELLDGASDETVDAVEGWLLDVARQRMATDV